MEEIPFDIGAIPTLDRISVDERCSPSVLTSAKRIKSEEKNLGHDSLRVIFHAITENREPSDYTTASPESSSRTPEPEVAMQKLEKSPAEELYNNRRQNSTVLKAEEAEAKGYLALSTGNFVEAVRHYTDAINLGDSDHLLYINRLKAHIPLGQFSEALLDAQKIVQLKPNLSIGYGLLGSIYCMLHNYKDAVSTCEKGLEINPTNDNLRSMLFILKGQEAFSNGNFIDAVQYCTELINLHPTRYILYYCRSEAHTGLKQLSEAVSDAQKVVQLKPDWVQGYFQLGDAYSNLSNCSCAISTYKKGLKIDPTNDELKHRLFAVKGENAFFSGNFVGAIQYYTDGINLYPSDHILYHNRSLAHTGLKQLSEAVSDAQKIVQLKPDWVQGYFQLGYAYSNLSNYSCAISTYEKGLKIDPTNDELKHRLFAVKGENAFFSGNFVGAIQYYTDGINLYPSDHILYHNRSLAHTSLKQLSDAVSDAQKTVQLKSDWIQGYFRLGYAYFALGNYKCAISTYEKGLEIDPTNDELKHRDKGREAHSNGNLVGAIQHYTDAINLSTTNFLLYHNRSEAHSRLKQFSEALSDAKRTVELNPYWSKGYLRLGLAYFDLGKYDDALSAYKKGFETDPSDDELNCQLLHAKGVMACNSGSFVDAIQHFTDAINLYPSDHELYRNRSLAHTHLKQLSQALSDAQKIVQLKPDWIEGHFRLGDTYFHLRKYKDAVSAYEKGLEIDPTNEKVKSMLFTVKGQEAFSKGNISDAIQYYKDAVSAYEKILEIDPTNDKVKLILFTLKSQQTFSNGNFNDAIQYNKDAVSAYEKILEINPTNDKVKCLLFTLKGQEAFSKGNFIDAVQHYTDVINLDPSEYVLYYNRSEAHTRLKQLSEALSDAQKVVQLKPDWIQGYFRLGYAYVALRNYKCAISTYEKGLEIDPTNNELKHRLFTNKGQEAHSNGNFAGAIQHYTDAINLCTTNYLLYHNRSESHSHLKQLSEAISDAKRTVELNPDWSKGYLRLGLAYIDLGKYNDALSAYKKGFETDPSDDELKCNLLNAKGTVARNTGNFTDAIQHFTECINLYPSNYIFYANRSEAHTSFNQFSKAMSDAQQTILLAPRWSRGYLHLGDVYLGLRIYNDAVSTYKKSLYFDRTNYELKSALTIARTAWATRKRKDNHQKQELK